MQRAIGIASCGLVCGLVLAAKAAGADQDQPPAAPEESNYERLWDEPKAISFQPHNQSFAMFTHTNTPDNAPTSPNPDNRVPPTYDLNQGEAKFQISFKTLALSERLLPYRNSLWFGYTQQSYWQIFDGEHSRPFRESNYEPELIFSHRMSDPGSASPGLRVAFLNLGVVHQSNGQSDPRSRSWNRVYGQVALVDRLSGDSSYAVLLRPWWRFPENRATDDNPDITHYLGYGEIEALYWKGHYLVSLLARKRSIQADLSTPLPFLTAEAAHSLQLHFQVFTGYGESLIDYNQRHTTIGMGIAVPYGLE